MIGVQDTLAAYCGTLAMSLPTIKDDSSEGLKAKLKPVVGYGAVLMQLAHEVVGSGITSLR
jgi:hypothetical protein